MRADDRDRRRGLDRERKKTVVLRQDDGAAGKFARQVTALARDDGEVDGFDGIGVLEQPEPVLRGEDAVHRRVDVSDVDATGGDFVGERVTVAVGGGELGVQPGANGEAPSLCRVRQPPAGG